MIVKTQKEYNQIDVEYDGGIEITGELSRITARPKASIFVSGNAVIQSVSGNAVKIERLCQQSVCISVGRKIKIKHIDKTASYLVKKVATHDIDSFINIYGLKKKNNCIELFKSVNPETECDFYTGKIKYTDKKTVVCPDFDSNPDRECGGGLHLSPTPELARNFDDRLVKKCRVNIKDIVVYKNDIKKVRCRKVYVIGAACPFSK